MRDRIYFRNDRCLRHKSLRRNNLILSSGLPQVMRQHYTAASRRDRERRAGVIREQIIHGKNLPTRIQRITPSKATELCTAASRRDRQRRAGVIREDIIHGKNFPARIQRLTLSNVLALHRCLYDSKSVKNDCISNCLAFTCNIMASSVEVNPDSHGKKYPRGFVRNKRYSLKKNAKDVNLLQICVAIFPLLCLDSRKYKLTEVYC